MSVHPPAPSAPSRGTPSSEKSGGEAALDHARRGKLTAWLARRYAGVWPARDDLPGELWRPITGAELAREAFVDADRA